MKYEAKNSHKSYRKEVTLTHGVVVVLSELANKERRTLKNYMESVLINHAHDNAETNGKLKTKVKP